MKPSPSEATVGAVCEYFCSAFPSDRVKWPSDFRRELAYTSFGGSWVVETEKAAPRAK